MTAWVVRGGSRGEYEETFVSEGVVAINFGVATSIAGFASRQLLREHYTVSGNVVGNLWRFTREIGNGDMVVLPRKSPRVVAVGKVLGDYDFRPSLEAPHVRPVSWIAHEIPLTDFDLDLRTPLRSDLTVYRIRATDAEPRIEKIIAKHLSNSSTEDTPDTSDNTASINVPDDDEPTLVDIGELITDRIVERIRERFYGTRLEYLVASILRASGYHAVETRQGPGGGIDVVAGQGDMGFGHPRLCVQVKSGRNPVDIADYNRLQGNIGGYWADHGLFVSLGDFTRTVCNENERSFFQIRL